MTGDTGIHEQMISDDGAQGAVSALAIVSTELMETIRNAHLALEDCVDGRGGTAALDACRRAAAPGARRAAHDGDLRRRPAGRGNGAGHCATWRRPRSGKRREDGLDALMRAMVQLPSYIERVLGGGRDIALVLLPMLNDLRAVRGSPLLSEGTLLLLNLSADARRSASVPARAGEDPVVVGAAAATALPAGLLGWISGERHRQNLETLASRRRSSNRSATRDRRCTSCGGWSAASRGAAATAASKRRRGQAPARPGRSRNPEALSTRGLLAYERHPIDDLLNNLLYYVARSGTSGSAVRRSARVVQSDRTAERRRAGRTGAREPVRAEREAHARRWSRRSARTWARSRTCSISSCARA